MSVSGPRSWVRSLPPGGAGSGGAGLALHRRQAAGVEPAVAPLLDLGAHLSLETEWVKLLLLRRALLRGDDVTQVARSLGVSPDVVSCHESSEVSLQRLSRRAAALRAEIDRRLLAGPASGSAPGVEGAPLPAQAAQQRLRLSPAALHLMLLLLVLERSLPCLLVLRAGLKDEVTGFPLLGQLDELLGSGERGALSVAHLLRADPGDGLELSACIELLDGPGARGAPLCLTPVRLRPRMRDYLLGIGAMAESLQGVVERPGPPRIPLAAARDRAFVEQQPPTCIEDRRVLWLVGPPGAGRRTLAMHLCQRLQRTLWIVSWNDLAYDAHLCGPRLRDLVLESWLTGPVLLLDWRGPWEPGRDQALHVLRRLGQGRAPLLLGTAEMHVGVQDVVESAVPYRIAAPEPAERAGLFEQMLARRGAGDGGLDEGALLGLSRSFPLHPGQIQAVVAMSDGRLRGSALLRELRGQCLNRVHGQLAELADLVRTSFTWEDLIVPPEVQEALYEIVIAVRHRERVLVDWEMGRKTPYGRGTHVMFSGPPGTGKTMAASVLANELGLELFRVDLSRIVNKYVGETEKNLGRVFAAAAGTQAVLFFDEADALFSKRTGVQSSVDRYANLETGYLLQRLELHDGMTILSTNLPHALDDAFRRRIPYRVQFELPDAAQREQLWDAYLRAPLPVLAEVDLGELSRRFDMSPAHIKNAVLRAALYAADAGQPISGEMLTQAAVLEMHNLGKIVPG